MSHAHGDGRGGGSDRLSLSPVRAAVCFQLANTYVSAAGAAIDTAHPDTDSDMVSCHLCLSRNTPHVSSKQNCAFLCKALLKGDQRHHILHLFVGGGLRGVACHDY